MMKNPWETIKLDDYENHMKLASVSQLQAMNQMMKGQLDYPVSSVMILGVAGGNGLEHIQKTRFKKVYGVDVNQHYLDQTAERYADLADILDCRRVDLTADLANLPRSELVIANLLIEYIGYSSFQKIIQKVAPKYVSCIIQQNPQKDVWVSDSPYLHSFDCLDSVHHQIETSKLTETMSNIGYIKIKTSCYRLPDKKVLIQLDFERN
ncbi:MAG: class I SAM-dependent methyltransferase [Streptococcus gallolyticus]